MMIGNQRERIRSALVRLNDIPEDFYLRHFQFERDDDPREYRRIVHISDSVTYCMCRAEKWHPLLGVVSFERTFHAGINRGGTMFMANGGSITDEQVGKIEEAVSAVEKMYKS